MGKKSRKRTNRAGHSGGPIEFQRQQLATWERVNKRKQWFDFAGRLARPLCQVFAVVAGFGLPSWAFVAAAPYYAGRETDLAIVANVSLSFLDKLWLSLAVVGWAIAIFAISIARRERRLRIEDAQRMGDDLKQKQAERDPNRESSGFVPGAEPAEDTI